MGNRLPKLGNTTAHWVKTDENNFDLSFPKNDKIRFEKKSVILNFFFFFSNKQYPVLFSSLKYILVDILKFAIRFPCISPQSLYYHPISPSILSNLLFFKIPKTLQNFSHLTLRVLLSTNLIMSFTTPLK